jgi:hypothetical protein
MFNESTVKAVFESTPTAGTIRDVLSERIRFRHQTNLNKFRNDLLSAGHKIVEKEYIETFQKLDQLGVGSLIIGRRGKPNRFLWNYNLKDVAKSAKGTAKATTPIVKVEAKAEAAPVKKEVKMGLTKRGRPFRKVLAAPSQPAKLATQVSVPVPKISAAPVVNKDVAKAPLAVTINLPSNVSKDDIAALLQLVSELGK